MLILFCPVVERKASPSSSHATRRICGLLGVVNLINGPNLIVATHRICAGVINGQAIWQLAGYEIFPYVPVSLKLNDVQKAQSETYLSMLRTVLDTPFFYFSYTYDLTHSLQRLHSMPPEFFLKVNNANSVQFACLLLFLSI